MDIYPNSQNDSEVVAKCDNNKVNPSLEFLNLQKLIKKFLSLPRREDSVKSSYTCAKAGFTFAEGATHVNMPPILAKAGFTLAEVLITLGIIGVVAAMTIPNLIMSYQKKATVTKLQKAISVLNQAYKLSFDEFGEPSNEQATLMGGEEFFKTYYAPFLKVHTYCLTHEDCGYDSTHPFKHFDDSIYDVTAVAKKSRSTFWTPDGFIYIIFLTQGVGDSRLVLVDINGSEKPNIIGRDVFMLERYEEKGILPRYYDRSDEYINANCTVSNGTTCAEKIRRAGWQIDSSYPWK